MSLGSAIIKIMNFLHPAMEERVLWAANKVNNGGDMEDIDTIVDDYFYLIKKVYRKNRHFKKPQTVELTDNCMQVMIDGEEYDFDVYIHHNDGGGTERKMEIGILYDEEQMREIVQEKLSAKIENEW